MSRFKVCTCDVRTMMYVDVVASLLWADHKNSRYQDMQSFWTRQEQGRRRETPWRQKWQNRTVVRNVSRNPIVLARQVYDELPPKISAIQLIFKKSCESANIESSLTALDHVRIWNYIIYYIIICGRVESHVSHWWITILSIRSTGRRQVCYQYGPHFGIWTMEMCVSSKSFQRRWLLVMTWIGV